MILTIAIAGLSVLAVAALGRVATEIGPWYRGLRKPALQPPDWAFGPVWTVLLILVAGAGARAWQHAPDASAQTLILVLFAINAVFYVLWSLLFFRLRRPDWALSEVVFLWLSILSLVVSLAPFSPLAAWLLVPYLVWVAFAAYLNFAVVRLNRPFGQQAPHTI